MFIDFIDSTQKLFALLFYVVTIFCIINLLWYLLPLNRLTVSSMKLWNKWACRVQKVLHFFIKSIFVNINQRIFNNIDSFNSLLSNLFNIRSGWRCAASVFSTARVFLNCAFCSLLHGSDQKCITKHFIPWAHFSQLDRYSSLYCSKRVQGI